VKGARERPSMKQGTQWVPCLNARVFHA